MKNARLRLVFLQRNFAPAAARKNRRFSVCWFLCHYMRPLLNAKCAVRGFKGCASCGTSGTYCSTCATCSDCSVCVSLIISAALSAPTSPLISSVSIKRLSFFCCCKMSCLQASMLRRLLPNLRRQANYIEARPSRR